MLSTESDSTARRASLDANLLLVRRAALDRSPVSGLTHRFYRYPARFSPQFAAAAIEAFSKPGDLVLDPYMGGGTTVVEAMIRGRYGVGCDLNSLAVFVARAKTARLSEADVEALKRWADNTVPALSYWLTPDDIDDFICQRRTKNLTLPEARPIKKVLALALRSLSAFSTEAECLARCALLNTGQWALNGRTRLERVNLRNHLFAVNGERYRGRKPVFEVVAPVLLKARDGANEGISKTPGLHALVFTALMDANGKPNTGQEQFESREEAALHQDTTAKTLHVVLVHPSPPM